MRQLRTLILAASLATVAAQAKKPKTPKVVPPTPLENYVKQAHDSAQGATSLTAGSAFVGPSPLADLATDVKARYVNDIVTIQVLESANAVSTGVTKTQRTTSSTAGLSSAAGSLAIPTRLGNILSTNGDQQLAGQGSTTRTTTLTTTLSARVVDVLPNGFLVIEGSRNVVVNSENQLVTLRGVVRPNDLNNFNTVSSSAISQMELSINGKGVVNDVIRRPNFLYRLLLGALPF